MPNKGEYNVLIIEDNPGDFTLVEEFLLEKMESPLISYAPNYRLAKEVLSACATPFDIILLDLSLPDKTGEALIRDIVEISHNATVIVLTGYTDFDFGVKSLSLGATDYILKEELTPLTLYKSIVYSIERKKITSALETSEKRVRNFANQLNNALEEERARIAREIHDEFGQQLSGLKMSLSSLKRANGLHNNFGDMIDVLVADVNTSIESVRHIANELRPVLIDKLGLFAAIEWLITTFEKKIGVAARLYIDFDQPIIDKVLEINMFRICQEALTNIARHAKATLVKIHIEDRDELLYLKIIDNGQGIKPNVMHNPLSMGLLNMRERANLIGAKFNITSSSETGTIIELIVNKNGKKNFNSR